MIDSYCQKHITFVLKPLYVGEYDVNMLLQIEYKNNTEYRPFSIKFRVVDLPVYVEKKINQLDYLIENNTFRHKLMLHNSSNISYKLQVSVHKDLNPFIELNPVLGYIQV